MVNRCLRISAQQRWHQWRGRLEFHLLSCIVSGDIATSFARKLAKNCLYQISHLCDNPRCFSWAHSVVVETQQLQADRKG